MLLEEFPRYPCCSGRARCTRWIGSPRTSAAPRIWAKREDCNSGLAYGGNKTRKLEYLVPDALAQGADTLVSIGGIQSNHTRQVAAVAAHAGLKARLVQESWVDWPDAVNDRVGNILLSRIMGAHVELVESGFGIEFKQSWENGTGGRPSRWWGAVPDPGRRLRSPARRSRASPTGRTRSRSRRPSSASSSIRSWSAASPAAPRPG